MYAQTLKQRLDHYELEEYRKEVDSYTKDMFYPDIFHITDNVGHLNDNTWFEWGTTLIEEPWESKEYDNDNIQYGTPLNSSSVPIPHWLPKLVYKKDLNFMNPVRSNIYVTRKKKKRRIYDYIDLYEGDLVEEKFVPKCIHKEDKLSHHPYGYYCLYCCEKLRDGPNVCAFKVPKKIYEVAMKRKDPRSYRDEYVLSLIGTSTLTDDDLDFKKYIVDQIKENKEYSWYELGKIAIDYVQEGDQYLRIPALFGKISVWNGTTWNILMEYRKFVIEHSGLKGKVNLLYGMKRIMQEQGMDIRWFPCKLERQTLRKQHLMWLEFSKCKGLCQDKLRNISINLSLYK